jgi:hypothetical protein
LAEVLFMKRESDRTWVRKTLEGLDQTVEMPLARVRLALFSIYDGVEFPERPRLVSEGPAQG